MPLSHIDGRPYHDDDQQAAERAALRREIVRRSFLSITDHCTGYCPTCNCWLQGSDIEPYIPIDTIEYHCLYCGTCVEIRPLFRKDA